MSAAVELHEVVVRAGRRAILGPVDLEIGAGEHVTLVGPSGCGKTTLLRAVAGLARVHSGRISLGGELVTSGSRRLVAPEERRIGMLFQGSALWPHFSARRTLEFVMKNRGVPRAERARRVTELLELVELQGFEARKPGTLSGGEAQRLALARALAGDPRILLLDEPLGPLDAALRRSMLAHIDRIQKEHGLTLIHVTHDPAESERYATRSLAMEAGRLVEVPA